MARSGGLILLSLMLFGFGGGFPRAGDMNAENIGRFVAELFRAGLWEVLAIIGAVQLMILPWAGARTGIRVAALIVLAVLHTSLSWSFNFDFVYGRPNWLDGYFGAAGKRCWDGGFFGLLAWSEVMLAGTLAADLMDARRPINTARRLAVLGALLMATGYALSCLTRLYDVVGVSGETPVAGVAASEQLAASPVLPPFSALQGRHWTTLIAEPPFVPPPSSDQRPLNYWMMNKRVVTQSFVLFGTGFSMSLLGAFVAACDRGRMNLTVLRMFGQNPLAAYIIHHFVSETILTVVPDDSPGALAVAGTLVSFGVTWHFVAFLERRRLFLRL